MFNVVKVDTLVKVTGMSLGCDSLVCVRPMTDEGVFVELIE